MGNGCATADGCACEPDACCRRSAEADQKSGSAGSNMASYDYATTDERDQDLDTPGFPMEPQAFLTPRNSLAAQKPPAAPEAPCPEVVAPPRGTRNGGDSKFVDSIEAVLAEQNSPAAPSAPKSPAAPKAQGKRCATLIKGMRSGEVSKLVNNMQAARSQGKKRSMKGHSERLSQMSYGMTPTLSDYSVSGGMSQDCLTAWGGSSGGYSHLVESSTEVHQLSDPSFASGKDACERTWKIRLDRQAGTSLGINVDRNATRNGLLVTGVSDSSDSMIATWNQDHPNLALDAGDVIVAVNGHRGKTEALIQHCQQKFPESLEVVRGSVESVNSLPGIYESQSTYDTPEVSNSSGLQPCGDQSGSSSTDKFDVPPKQPPVSSVVTVGHANCEPPPKTLVERPELQLQVEFLSTKGAQELITVNFTRRPLGMGAGWDSTLPIKVTKVAPKGHAEELGVEVGWKIMKVAGTTLTDENAAFICGGTFLRTSAP